MPPPEVQVQLWSRVVQMPRRIAGLRHRVEKAEGSGEIELKFGYYSMNLHKQTPDPDRVKMEKTNCCTICSRRKGPDIFEVVYSEESAVPQLPIFRRWLDQRRRGDYHGGDDDQEGFGDREDTESVSSAAIGNLYAEEFGWQCCIVTGREHDTAWQEKRADCARGSFTDLDSILVGNKERWDLLG